MEKGAKIKINLNDNNMRKIAIFIFTLIAFIPSADISAQTVNFKPNVAVVAPNPSAKSAPIAGKVQKESEIPAEKFIVADVKVNISLCVTEGAVKINGWKRNEIRVFVEGGSDAGFSVRDKNKQTGQPNLINVLGFDPAKNKEDNSDECLSGDEIELDVPQGATVNLIGHESDIAVSTVSKIKIENDGGNIYLNDIAQGIDAKTYQGNVMVEKSRGMITLNSTNGNIVVFDTESNEVGDGLQVRTISGGIVLQQVTQKQVEANSNTGSIRFDSTLEKGGQYSFGTTNGAINLLIPADSSFKIEAFYGGAFRSEIPLKTLTKDINPQVQRMIAVFGTGDASVNLTNLSGAIRIRKK